MYRSFLEHNGRFGLVYWGLTPQQQPRSYQGGEMMMMKSVFWWRKPEYPEETTDLRQVTNAGHRYIILHRKLCCDTKHFGPWVHSN